MAATMEVKVPDIGDFKDIPVIEIHVKPGDVVKAEDALVTLESDKATMDVPAPAAGTVKEVKVALGHKVSEGAVIVLLEAGEVAASAVPVAKEAPPVTAPVPAAVQPEPTFVAPVPESSEQPILRPTEQEPTTAPLAVHIPSPAETVAAMDGMKAHASPSVRASRASWASMSLRLWHRAKRSHYPARRAAFVKGVLYVSCSRSRYRKRRRLALGGGLDLLPWPKVDFAKFGPIEVKPLSRIKKISGPNLAATGR